MAYRKHFSFSSKEVYEHVVSQRNASAYIEELVQRDMNNINFVTLDDVKRIVQQYMQSNPSPAPTTILGNIDNNEADLVMSSVQSLLELGG